MNTTSRPSADPSTKPTSMAPLKSGVDHALRQGWALIPLRRDKKAPAYRTGPGHRRALTNADDVDRWLRRGQLSFGIRTGDGLIVIDHDNLSISLPDLPPTYTVRTGRVGGGFHYYYRSDRPVRGTSFPGGDLKATGGFVLCAGSIHPETGVIYTVEADRPIAAAPAWVYELKAPETLRPEPGMPVAEGGRRNFLVSEAGRLRNAIDDEAVLAAALHALNEHRCVPPLRCDEYDIDRLAADMMTKDGRGTNCSSTDFWFGVA